MQDIARSHGSMRVL